jgi:hypothetical protein
MRWLLWLALAGCTRESRAPASTPPAPDAGSACVAECVQQSQMKAVSPEQIEADCRRDCATRP